MATNPLSLSLALALALFTALLNKPAMHACMQASKQSLVSLRSSCSSFFFYYFKAVPNVLSPFETGQPNKDASTAES